MFPSVRAVLGSHLQTLEMMATRIEELSLRTTDLQECQRLREFARKYRLIALEHRNYLDALPAASRAE